LRAICGMQACRSGISAVAVEAIMDDAREARLDDGTEAGWSEGVTVPRGTWSFQFLALRADESGEDFYKKHLDSTAGLA